MSLTSWFLVSSGGTRHRLPREMIFVGRDDCELMLQSRSVDKQHAVINYDPDADQHRVKDLGSLNGTFVNEVRIQEQVYVTLGTDDKLRFGYDSNLFTVLRAELQIPEEALKHEKLSSQLQLSQRRPPEAPPSHPEAPPPCEGGNHTPRPHDDPARPPEGPADRPEDKGSGELGVFHRGTPLYGQPAWWGDGEEEDARKRERTETDSKHSADHRKSSSNQEPSYFEIPTKEAAPSAVRVGGEQEAGPSASAGHASFTIEFDPSASAKAAPKVSKPAPETRPRPKRPVGEELSPLQTAMVAAEVKVADWLAQNELPDAIKEAAAAAAAAAAEGDEESTKSDVQVHLRSLKGSRHDDGTQSDCELPPADPRCALWAVATSGTKFRESRANVPEGLFAEEESPARRRRTARTARTAGTAGTTRTTRTTQPQQGKQEKGERAMEDTSDRATYTIELEEDDQDAEDARNLIDRVFGVDQQSGSLTWGVSDQKERGKTGRLGSEVLVDQLVVGGPRWVSQWATLAASHIRTDPEGSGGDAVTMTMEDREIRESAHSLASSGYTECKRRLLPQPPGGGGAGPGRRSPGPALKAAMGEKQDTELQEKENQEGRRSDRERCSHGSGGGRTGSPAHSSPARSQDSSGGRSGILTKLPPRPLTSGERRVEEARKRRKEEEKESESVGKPLLRQESFTIDKPSANVPIELIPRIDSLRTHSREALEGADLQRDSEAVAAFLDTTVSDHGDPPSQSIEGSASPESDVDTTSTVSQADGSKKLVQRRRVLARIQKEGTVVCSSSAGSSAANGRAKTRMSGPAHSARPWTSLELTDDDLNSTSMLSDVQLTKTNEFKSSKARLPPGGPTVCASTKSSRAKTTQPTGSASSSALSKTSSVPKPRPTRASLLRRARLADSSDTEPADLDRLSVASEASTASSASRTGMAKKGMSRIEALAQPRRPRVGSPSAQSDSEATVSRSGLRARGVAADYATRHGLRGSAGTGAGPRARANSASKLPDKSRGSSAHSQVVPAAATRWRSVPVEYASTSEDEFGSNRHLSKPGTNRTLPATRLAQTAGSAPPTHSPANPQQPTREQEEYVRDWTAHSEEIARISQDLAKDLAMLAREIHDVAGEIDSVSPAHTDPGATLEALGGSLDLERSTADANANNQEAEGRSVELRSRRANGQNSRAIRRQTWNREDAVLDGLILAAVTQLSSRIRQSVDRTATKIRILFKDKERKWDEIESKLQAEHDSLLLRSSNQEVSSVLQDLRRVEKQLAVIDMMVDPDGTLEALSSLGITSPLADVRLEQGGGAAMQGGGDTQQGGGAEGGAEKPGETEKKNTEKGT